MALMGICGPKPPLQRCWPRFLHHCYRQGIHTVFSARGFSARLRREHRFTGSCAGNANAAPDLLSKERKLPSSLFRKAKEEEPYAQVKQHAGASLEKFDSRSKPKYYQASQVSAADMELSVRQQRQQDQPTFFVRRTASENIPVYLRWKNKRNKVSTILRKTRGDKEELMAELAALCESPVFDRGGYVEIMGNHQQLVKQTPTVNVKLLPAMPPKPSVIH